MIGSHRGPGRRRVIRAALFIVLVMLVASCMAQGQKAVIVVIDGARYSETFGAGAAYLPRIWTELRREGTIWTNFRNDGVTTTVPGHSSILSGTWQAIANDGTERPTKPVLFEYFRQATGAPDSRARVVVGKGKLDVLAYSTDPRYGQPFGARVSVCDDDTAVCRTALEILKGDHPSLMLVNFPDVDLAGHAGDWPAYLEALSRVDSLVAELWRVISVDPAYRGKTLFFVTNDHGRHLDTVSSGFTGHGDNCEGCRHILLFGAGGGLSKGYECRVERTQRDIAPSIGEWLEIPTPESEGVSLLGDTLKTTDVMRGEGIAPAELRLLGAYPNPFNSGIYFYELRSRYSRGGGSVVLAR